MIGTETSGMELLTATRTKTLKIKLPTDINTIIVKKDEEQKPVLWIGYQSNLATGTNLRSHQCDIKLKPNKTTWKQQ